MGLKYGTNMGLVQLNTARIWVLAFLGTGPKIVILQNGSKNAFLVGFWWFWSFVWYVCSTLLHFGNPESFFPNEKIQLTMFQIYLGMVLVGKKSSNDSRLTVITTNVVRHVPRASGPFLVRTASQSQRGGSIINMKGTVRDRSKDGINKGVWIL